MRRDKLISLEEAVKMLMREGLSREQAEEELAVAMETGEITPHLILNKDARH